MHLAVEVAEKATESGKMDSIAGLFRAFPEHVYSSSPGEPAPALVDRKHLFERMYKIARSARLRELIRSRIRDIDEDIARGLKRDNDFLNPRI